MGNLFAVWWNINPVLTVIIIGSIVLFVLRFIIALFSSDSSDSSNVSINYEKRSQTEQEKKKQEEEWKREEKEKRDRELAAYILYKEHEHEKKLRNAKCGQCVHCIPRHDENSGESYYECACDGHIISYQELNGHYCRDFYTL